MLTGRTFRLLTPTLAIAMEDRSRHAVTVPAGAVLKIVSGPSEGDRMIDVLWEGRVYAMFTIDVLDRGDEIRVASN